MTKPVILYDNSLDASAPVASTTAAGDFDVLNLRDWRPYTSWRPTALPATVTVDEGTAKARDYALIWGHDLATQGCTVEVRGSTDNFVASDVLVASATPASDGPFAIYFASASYRYWRLAIDFTNLAQAPSAVDDPIWSKADITISANSIAAPDGSMTADKVREIATDAFHRLTQILTYNEGERYAWSAAFKPAERSFAVLRMPDGAFTPSGGVVFDLLTGQPTSIGGTYTTESVDLGGGWWRLKIIDTCLMDLTQVSFFFISSDGVQISYPGIGGHGFYIWDAQLQIIKAMPTLAIAAIGSLLEIPATLREGFDPTKRDPQGRINRSVEGRPIGSSVLFEEWKEGLKFQFVTWDWVRATWVPAWKAHLRGTPFVFAWERTGHPTELHLVTRSRGYRTPHKAGGLTDLELDVVGLAL